MAIKVPKVVTGRWIANLIHRSKLKWLNGSLHENGAYCALGMIAKEAGLSNNQVENMGNHGGAAVININDRQQSRKEVIQAFCMVGDRPLAIDGWMDRLREKVRRRKK
jgi:hypothetical protein